MVKVLCLLGMFCCSASLQAKEWLAVQEMDLKVQAQSALDFSTIFPMQTESLSIQDGHFFTTKSNQKQRMHCAVMAFTRLKGGFPDKKHAEALANELQRRGYNFLRLHMLDMALMVGAKKNFDFNLQEMDKLFYLVYVLQKHGIYIELDAETSWNGGFADVAFPFEKNKHAIVMPARPGAGKSTLTAGLVSRGWRLLSDELALICPETQELVGLSRPVNLKNESISIIKQFAPEVLFSDEIKDTNKGTVSLMQAPAKSVERAGERAKISCFVIPEYVSEHATQLDRLNKAEMFMHIADNAFNYSLHGLSGYKTVARILEFADAWQLTYSELGEAINVFDKMVEHG